MDCDFERENVDLKSVFVIVIVIVFGSDFFFFLVGPRIGPNPLMGPGKGGSGAREPLS